jgi:hypothetical protein
MKFNLTTVLLLIIIVLGILYGMKSCENSKINEKLAEEQNLKLVLNDSIHKVILKNGEIEYTKKSLQDNVDFLQKNISSLSDNQKALLDEVKSNKQIVSAMRDKMEVILSNLNQNTVVALNDTTYEFTDSTKDIEYNIIVSGIKPSTQPKLDIQNLVIPNNQNVSFQFDKTKGNPVSVSIINSNPYVKLDSVDSFIIPAITKTQTKPNIFQKTGKVIKQTKDEIIVGGIILCILKIFKLI